MFRRLTAIEIAEGALLANIAVIFQLLVKILPVGGVIFELLIPVVFAVIVLRRSFYVGCMSFVVALFITTLISGPGSAFTMLLGCGAGLFLGLTMKHRMSHFAILFLGIISGLFAYLGLLLFFDLLTGAPLSYIVIGIHAAFNGLVYSLGLIASIIGLSAWWQHTAFPALSSFAALLFSNWWAPVFLFLSIYMVPVVIFVYYITNLFVRLLGYQVHPFPGGKIEAFFYWLLRKLVKLIPKRGIGKHWAAQMLTREVRRLGIARQKSKT
jgi:hypothetical protein